MSTKARQYVLSPHCRLLAPTDMPDLMTRTTRAVDRLRRGEAFILRDEYKDKSMLITPLIRQFLLAFRPAATVDTVVARFAREAGCTTADIASTVRGFFKDMVRRGLLIPEEVEAKVSALDERRALFRVGDRAGAYRIDSPLVDRRQLELYRAVDTRSGEVVVLKALNLDKELLPKYKHRKRQVLVQEFQLLRELRAHPAICQFIHLKAGPKRYYGVMEAIEGQSLRREVKYATRSLERRIDLVGQVLGVMAHVHACGILHGDLHNSNFLIQPDGRLRLIDFDLGNHRRLRKGEVYRQGGVHEYIPPERLDGRTFRMSKRRPDYRAEVHQIGVILYYILYGKLPFEAFTWKELVAKISTEKPVLAPVSPEGEPYPEGLLKILRRCLRKAPRKRYKSAQTLRRAFERKVMTSPVG